jgi:diguanylate cyclase (GGDEF)-like protein
MALERARLQASLAEQALLDPLTDVANRRRLELALAETCDRPEEPLAVVAIDLDGFKAVNDRLGHDAGDELLRIAARRLVASVRTGDVVARTGGDEFVVLLRDVRSAAVAERITRHISDRFAEPVHVGRWQLPRIPASIGFAVAPEDGTNPQSLIRAADQSMYVAKRTGSGRPRGITLTDIPLQQTDEAKHVPVR